MSTFSRIASIEQLDLSRIRVRLVHVDGLSEADAHSAVEGLRDFYQDYLENPLGPHRPSCLVDKAWHAHILHTRQYAADCQRIFEQFLHHEPRESSFVGDTLNVHADCESESGGYCDADCSPDM